MKHLHLLAPDVERAKQLIDELRQEGIEERHIHLIAKDHALLEKEHLPEASLLQESDVVPAVEKGVAAGGVTGLLAGIAAITFPPAGLALGGGAVLGTGLLGAGLGGLISGLTGISHPNSRLEEFKSAIEEGHILMLIDAPKDRFEEIAELVKKHQNDWFAQLSGQRGPT